jgi:hypothetical protein
MAEKKWIQKALGPKSKGKLHEEMHVPKGEKIPKKKLAKAEKSSGTLGKRARLAETLEKLHKR